MKITILTAFTSVAFVAAQSINIASPADGQTVPSNKNITLQVQLPDSLSPALQLPQLIIGVLACQKADCSDIADNALFNTGGSSPQPVPFTPKRVDRVQPAYQNFSISLGGTDGTKLVRVMHVFGVGAALQPTMEFKVVRLIASSPPEFSPRWTRT